MNELMKIRRKFPSNPVNPFLNTGYEISTGEKTFPTPETYRLPSPHSPGLRPNPTMATTIGRDTVAGLLVRCGYASALLPSGNRVWR